MIHNIGNIIVSLPLRIPSTTLLIFLFCVQMSNGGVWLYTHTSARTSTHGSSNFRLPCFSHKLMVKEFWVLIISYLVITVKIKIRFRHPLKRHICRQHVSKSVFTLHGLVKTDHTINLYHRICAVDRSLVSLILFELFSYSYINFCEIFILYITFINWYCQMIITTGPINRCVCFIDKSTHIQVLSYS